METETLRLFMDNFGWPGLLYFTGLFILRWYITVKWPADREDRIKKIDADQVYRLAHTEKMDGLADEVHQNTRITEGNSKEVSRLRDCFIEAGIYKPKEY